MDLNSSCKLPNERYNVTAHSQELKYMRLHCIQGIIPHRLARKLGSISACVYRFKWMSESLCQTLSLWSKLPFTCRAKHADQMYDGWNSRNSRRRHGTYCQADYDDHECCCECGWHYIYEYMPGMYECMPCMLCMDACMWYIYACMLCMDACIYIYILYMYACMLCMYIFMCI